MLEGRNKEREEEVTLDREVGGNKRGISEDPHHTREDTLRIMIRMKN